MTARTEKAAAESWCPFARVNVGVRMIGGLDRLPGTHTGTVPEGPALNRWTTHEPEGEPKPFDNRLLPREDYARCVGSRCMAWRWLEDADGRRTGEGFCGLAGPG